MALPNGSSSETFGTSASRRGLTLTFERAGWRRKLYKPGRFAELVRAAYEDRPAVALRTRSRDGAVDFEVSWDAAGSDPKEEAFCGMLLMQLLAGYKTEGKGDR